jgi:hypothetical protein
MMPSIKSECSGTEEFGNGEQSGQFGDKMLENDMSKISINLPKPIKPFTSIKKGVADGNMKRRHKKRSHKRMHDAEYAYLLKLEALKMEGLSSVLSTLITQTFELVKTEINSEVCF